MKCNNTRSNYCSRVVVMSQQIGSFAKISFRRLIYYDDGSDAFLIIVQLNLKVQTEVLWKIRLRYNKKKIMKLKFKPKQ